MLDRVLNEHVRINAMNSQGFAGASSLNHFQYLSDKVRHCMTPECIFQLKMRAKREKKLRAKCI